ncbi:hypothetical protein B0H19DRAFT_1174838 [Mycena capillaripes]|nr:hypothetical protein B0H19DRAFT_1174838 [Mycena capillaripes]
MASYVVTGAARGIGFEFVKQFSADTENTVFAIVRNKATATGIEELSRKNITILQADVTDAKALKLAAAEVAKVTGNKLECLVNNAGKSNHSGFTLDRFPSPEAMEEDLLDNFKVNAVAVVHTINAFLPLLRNGSTKKVLTLSTGLADLEFTTFAEAAGEPAYSISKAAVNMIVAKYAAQYKSEGFVFLAISPGLVNTGMAPSEDSEEFKQLSKAIAKAAPDFKGPISPEQSVKMQIEVLNRWTVEQTGAFVSHFGTKQWL